MTKPQSKTAHMSEVHKKFKTGFPKDELILDVRDAEVYAEGHVPGSRNIPVADVSNHLDELKKYSKIYVHCGGGGKAGRAAKILTEAGLSQAIHICDSGFRWWDEQKYPKTP